MDAGIATETNIQYLKKEGYDYLCVFRSNIKNYQADITSKPVQIYDKKNQPIELLKVRVAHDTDHYLWVRSQAKEVKENSMNDQFSQRFEEGLRTIQYGIVSKDGTKRKDKVWERIGRLKEKYASINQHYFRYRQQYDCNRSGFPEKGGSRQGMRQQAFTFCAHRWIAKKNKRSGPYIMQ